MNKERISTAMLEVLITKGMHNACKTAKNSVIGKLLPFTYQVPRQNFLKHCDSLTEQYHSVEAVYKFISEACMNCSQNPPKCDEVDKNLKQYEDKWKKL